jgi:hypothetical protein
MGLCGMLLNNPRESCRVHAYNGHPCKGTGAAFHPLPPMTPHVTHRGPASDQLDMPATQLPISIQHPSPTAASSNSKTTPYCACQSSGHPPVGGV